MFEVGDRIKLVEMKNDPNPVPSGTVYHVGCGVVNVQWGNGRNLGVIIDEDEFINYKL